MSWKAIRAFASQTAESGAPSSSLLVALDVPSTPRVEVALDSGSTTGSPTSIVLTIWRGADGRMHKIGTWTIANADVATPIPQVFEFEGQSIHATVSFSGGTSPTLSGTLYARPSLGP